MNIPENILQQVADEAFAQSSSSPLSCVPNGTNWKRQPNIRRAVIQHALDNPALAPFLAGKDIARAENELASLKSAQLGILRPIAEMPETVQEGCMAVFRWRDDFGSWVTGTCKPTNGFFAILRLPDAEFTPPAEFAAQVPLGPEDVPPGSIVTNSADSWYKVKYVTAGGVRIDIQGSNLIDYEELKTDGWSINTSIPDTGRWDKDAWRDCSKPGKEVAK